MTFSTRRLQGDHPCPNTVLTLGVYFPSRGGSKSRQFLCRTLYFMSVNGFKPSGKLPRAVLIWHPFVSEHNVYYLDFWSYEFRITHNIVTETEIKCYFTKITFANVAHSTYMTTQ
jgi:hypothetical protein